MPNSPTPERITDMSTGAEALFTYLPVVPFGEPCPPDRVNSLDVVRIQLISPDGDEASRDIPYQMWRSLVARLARAERSANA